MGIRQKLSAEFGSAPNLEGKLGKQSAPDVIVANKRSLNYGLELSQSRFCGVLPGDGWSGRMEDSILHGCIPVIIQDGIHLPFENMLEYDKFAVRVAEDDVPHLISILRNMSESEVDAKLNAVQKIWQRFVYRDSIMLEAKRQQQLHNFKDEWATQYAKLLDDDVFATLIQVLHFKLHNDVWRKVQKQKKNWGMPASCNAEQTQE
ncbi:hypothetical protein O6H91_Y433300 [Diphasiastrum complanatum]|nr:hypothetical protein O6H91_Y433300 [Diphasiastrum complanatum]